MTEKIVLASNNFGKLREIQAVLDQREGDRRLGRESARVLGDVLHQRVVGHDFEDEPELLRLVRVDQLAPKCDVLRALDANESRQEPRAAVIERVAAVH